MENAKIYILKEKLVNEIAQSELPAGAIFYILKNLTDETEKLFLKQTKQQLEELHQKEDKETSNNTKSIESFEVTAEEQDKKE